MHTPFELEVLIHFATSHAPFPRECPILEETCNNFINAGILSVDFNIRTADKSIWSITEKGRAWLTAMLNVPYPTQIWIDEHGRRLEF